jgi:hypothetical protein
MAFNIMTLNKKDLLEAQMALSITILCHYADCRFAEYYILSIFKLNAIMLNVIMLSVEGPVANVNRA